MICFEVTFIVTSQQIIQKTYSSLALWMVIFLWFVSSGHLCSKTGLWQRYNGIRVPFTYFELWKILISFFSRRQWGLKWGCTERATPSHYFWKRRGGAFARRRFFCGLAGGWPAGFWGRHGGVHVKGWDFVEKKNLSILSDFLIFSHKRNWHKNDSIQKLSNMYAKHQLKLTVILSWPKLPKDKPFLKYF